MARGPNPPAEGADLHPYLRTGHEGCDRTLARVLALREERGERWKEIDGLLADAGHERAPASYGGVAVGGLSLDWDALAAVLPPLRAPVLTAGRTGVRWARPELRHPESYLHVYADPAEPENLRLGVNDLENGDDD